MRNQRGDEGNTSLWKYSNYQMKNKWYNQNITALKSEWINNESSHWTPTAVNNT